MQTIKISEFVKYNGHNIKASGAVTLSLKAMYSELTKTIQVLQMLNNDVKLTAKVEGEKKEIGMFRVKNVIVDDDGESTLKFESISDYVEMNNLNSLVGKDEFKLLMVAKVEDEENTEEE